MSYLDRQVDQRDHDDQSAEDLAERAYRFPVHRSSLNRNCTKSTLTVTDPTNGRPGHMAVRWEKFGCCQLNPECSRFVVRRNRQTTPEAVTIVFEDVERDNWAEAGKLASDV